MTELRDKDLLEAATRLRRESEHALDELTVARLRAVRLNVMAAKHGRRRFWGLAGGIAATAFALALAGLIWLKTPSEPAVAPPSEPSLADLELLSTESPEFYGNLEFYRWLESQSGAS